VRIIYALKTGRDMKKTNHKFFNNTVENNIAQSQNMINLFHIKDNELIQPFHGRVKIK
jgi:hypothetical protein